MAETEELGDVGTTLLFENDKVRIWELSLAPGERSDLHEHRYDNVLVQVSGDRVAVAPASDTRGIYDQYFEADIARGNSLFVEKGGIERAVNVGREPYYEIIVELKDPPASSSPS